MSQTTAAPKRTEGDMLALLRARHAKVGNGGSGEWAFLTHVRDEAGFSATRTIDALALSLWPSRGFELHGFEVKVSRSDWLRELADPAKADGAIARCDRWWLVAAEGVAKVAEMPTGWGLLVAQGDGLRAAVQAPKLPRTDAERLVSRSWLVCLLRAAGAVPKSRPEDIAKAHEEGFAEGKRAAERASGNWQKQAELAQERWQALDGAVREFEREAGFTLREWQQATSGRGAEIGRLVRAALDGDQAVRSQRDRLTRMAKELRGASERLLELAGVEESQRVVA